MNHRRWINLTLTQALEMQYNCYSNHGLHLNIRRERGTLRYYILPCWPGAFKLGEIVT